MQKYTVTVSENVTRWYKYGTNILHRENGPACEFTNGTKYWYKENKYHREDGPAIEYSDGTKEWYLEGEEYSEAEFNQLIQKKTEPTCDGKEVIIEGKKYILTLVDKA